MTSNKFKDFLKEDSLRSAHELGRTIGDINNLTLYCWKRFIAVSPPRAPLTFKDELKALIKSKIKEMPYLDMDGKLLNKLNNELHALLQCSLASQRTPDEIVDGLKSDFEMRNEVIELILSRVKLRTSKSNQRVLLENILSGDRHFRKTLNRQRTKKGFPFNI